MKNKTAHTCGQGSNEIASGYVTKARPGPPVATVETGKPVLYDINPNTENTTNPAKILVPQFKIGTSMESLKNKNKATNCIPQLEYCGLPFIVISEIIIASHIDNSTPTWTKREKYLYCCIRPNLQHNLFYNLDFKRAK